MNVFVTGVPVNERYRFASVILDDAEQGAARHCLEQQRNAAGDIIRLAHHRLGITISFA